MATITLSDGAPSDAGKISFSFSGVDFSLEGSDKYESDKADVTTAAAAHPWLEVSYPEPDPQDEAEYDSTDPHQNPAVDPYTAAYEQPEVEAPAPTRPAAPRVPARPPETKIYDKEVH